MMHSAEKTELRELTDLDIENVSGGNMGHVAGVAVALAIYGLGVVVGYALEKAR